jgi:hypothetical protein
MEHAFITYYFVNSSFFLAIGACLFNCNCVLIVLDQQYTLQFGLKNEWKTRIEHAMRYTLRRAIRSNVCLS